MTIESKQNETKGNKGGLRDRYWSLMLVGEHGRIIPFRRFKGIAIFLVAFMVLVFIAAVIIGFLYSREAKKVAVLQNDLENTQQQVTKLRDEKDMLLAQLVIDRKIEPKKPTPQAEERDNKLPVAQKQETSKAPAVQGQPIKSEVIAKEKSPAQAETPTEKQELKVKLGADIQQFSAGYQAERAILQAQFRIINDSTPKEPLAGRIVVLFKHQDESPIRWLSVPRVQLDNGIPNGKAGQAFKINNFRTMDFKAYGMKPPFNYNMVSIYVFSADGDLLLNKEFDVDLDIKQIEKVPDKPAATTPVDIKQPDPTETPIVQPPQESGGNSTPEESSSAGETSKGSEKPIAPATQPGIYSNPVLPVEQVTKSPTAVLPEEDNKAAQEKTEDTKPKPEGEQPSERRR